MKKLALLAITALAIPAMMTLQGCGSDDPGNGSDTTAVDNTPKVNMEGMVEYDMTENGLAYKLMVPNEDRAKSSPELSFNENSGYYELRVGERFWFTITEDEPDFELKKADLNDDLLFKNEFLKDEDGLLIYKSTLPDESKSFVRFYMVKELGGSKFIFEDEKMGEFTRGNIDNMVNAINTLVAVTPA
jgi:hypothetical protein